MRSIIFAVGFLALLAVCACTPVESDVIQHIPLKAGATPSVTGRDGAESGVVADAYGASNEKQTHERVRRSIGGEESDLIPAANDVDASPFGETSQLEGRGRIRVLPAFLG
ncbi:unnamed protein product [Diatraea saccharalis]|uniref:Uncharacterized protein n=1 Tax=Diatraea saccharalis TaxID=40085 RepID=A0A9N9RG25_9NEOP|nr:unnamed protein product [Diatraea saccharalis]